MLSEKAMSIVYFTLQFIFIVVVLYNYDRWYTLINFAYAIVLMALVYNYKPEALKVFLPVFAILLIPFFIVNGYLTGSWIQEQVVWYNDAENLGIRVSTVPIEDSVYALTMLLTIYVLMEKFREKYGKDKSLEEI